MSYNFYRGNIATLAVSSIARTSDMTQAQCSALADADGDGRPDAVDADIPGPGLGYFYLVTGRNPTADSPTGLQASPPRVDDLPCP